MMSRPNDRQADHTTSRYLDDVLNIKTTYFGNMVSQINPSELKLNRTNFSDTEAAFSDLHVSICNDICSILILKCLFPFYRW